MPATLPEITVRPPAAVPAVIATTPGGNPWDDAPDWNPQQQAAPQASSSAAPWADVPDWKPSPPTAPTREVGTGEAVARGALDTASFGLVPAMVGATKAGEAALTPEEAETYRTAGSPEEGQLAVMGAGLAKMFGSHADPAVRDAYERGRKSVLEDQRLAQEQHPYAFLGGQVVGGLATPGFGASTAGTLPARILTGAAAGGAGGALYGAGEAVSEGKSPGEVIKAAGKGAMIGAPTGGVLKGAIGPRVPGAAATPGQRAAQTSGELGAPLPRGVTSDSPAVQQITAKATEVPLAGSKITQAVKNTQKAAGEHIGDIATDMTAGTSGRTVADSVVRRGLDEVIADNKATADAAYAGVRGRIDQNAVIPMPQLGTALDKIVAARKAAGWANPESGLEQFRNLQNGATFNGAHRARVDAREAGNVAVPHPGYNKADYNRITQAMTGDLRVMAYRAAKGNPGEAVKAFDQAEKQFGRIAEQNEILNGLLNSKGEAAVQSLMGAASEKKGNLRLLAQLRTQMDPDKFAFIGGALLHELGQSARSGGEFSLDQFVTNWSKLSSGAKAALFSPQHLRNIEDIFDMAQHVKGALETANRSHTGGVFLAWETLKTAAEVAIAAGAGAVDPTYAAYSGGTFLLANAITRWLASPSKAASIAAFTRAGKVYQQNPTPGRRALFNLATRNMANNLEVDPTKLLRYVESQTSGKAEPSQQPDQQKQ